MRPSVPHSEFIHVCDGPLGQHGTWLACHLSNVRWVGVILVRASHFFEHCFFAKSTMKIALLFLVARVLTVTARQEIVPDQFSADSNAAKKLISDSRVLEDYFYQSAVASYSVVFEGCHMDSSWNQDGRSSVGVVSFSLCPDGYCSTNNGCTSKYKGTYAVSLETFLDAYLEARLEKLQYRCEMMREECGCDGNGDDCVWNCWKHYDDDSLDWTFCESEEDEMARYAECQLLEIEDAG